MQTSKSKSRAGLILIGAGVGLVTAFLLDPVSGKRRRAQVRDKSVRLTRNALDYAGRRVRVIRHRIKGTVYELRRDLSTEVEVDDLTLVQRVRSQLGHQINHARTIQVEANRGAVTLSGPVLFDEVEALVNCVERVPGVKSVEDRLDVHEHSENFPGLQGIHLTKGETYGSRH